MTVTCEYCHGQTEAGGTECRNCGAPVSAAPTAHDVIHCPYCGRRLLALGSPCCNYCGKRLPPEFISARDADMKRVTVISRLNSPPSDQGRSDVFGHPTSRAGNGVVGEIISGIIDLLN